MCKLFDWVNPMPPVEKIVLPYAEVWKDFGGLSNTGREDDWYHCAPIENVMEWCYACRSECPPYTSNSSSEMGFNCDDFAICFAAYVRRKKLTNALWQVWGLCSMVTMEALGLEPKGEIIQHPILGAATGHAWNIARCPDGPYEMEPQTGYAWVFGSNPSYQAHVLK